MGPPERSIRGRGGPSPDRPGRLSAGFVDRQPASLSACQLVNLSTCQLVMEAQAALSTLGEIRVAERSSWANNETR